MKSQRNFTQEDRRAALRLAISIGRRAAVRQLGISSASFQRWTEMEAEYWSSLRAGDPEQQQAQFAGRLEDLAEQYVDAELDALERAQKLIKTADAKETAALIKAMGSSRGLATVNARATRGQDADKLDVNINFPQIEQALERILDTAGTQSALPVPNLADSDGPRDPASS